MKPCSNRHYNISTISMQIVFERVVIMAGIRTRKRGKSWYFAFEAKNLNGKRKVVEKGGFKTEKDAIDAGIKAFANYKNGNLALVSDKITLEEFLNTWLETKSKEIRATTKRSYRICLNRIIPLIGNIDLKKLRPRDVALAMETISPQVNQKTSALILTILKLALNYAVYHCEFITVNPAAYIKPPKLATKKAIIKRQVISVEKIEELFATFPFGHPYHVPLKIAYHTGMRIGEILGLCWDSVNLDEGKISVVQQLCYTPETGYFFAPPKTQTSIWTILLDNQIISTLRQWRAAQIENEEKGGVSYLQTYEDETKKIWQLSKSIKPASNYILRPLVCVHENGKRITPRSLMYALHDCGLNAHSLRHTHATKLIEGGAIPKDVAARLGHADATITQNLYTHDTEEMQKETLRIFEKMLTIR